MTELASRAHMRQQPEVKPVAKVEAVMEPKVERVETVRESAYESVGVKDIVWESYYDLMTHFNSLWASRAIRSVETPLTEDGNIHAIVNGQIVERQPYIDSFAEMMRKEDFDNHTRLERYVNPLGPVGGLNWFKATVLGSMIENGKIGVKETVLGNRGVYMYRARTGNPFFRIWGGRTTLLIAVAQWLIFMAMFESFGVAGFGVENSSGWFITIFMFSAYLYNLVHWRFMKRYSFVISTTVVDGWKSRNFHAVEDVRWGLIRPAVYAINLSLLSTFMIVTTLIGLKNIGWL